MFWTGDPIHGQPHSRSSLSLEFQDIIEESPLFHGFSKQIKQLCEGEQAYSLVLMLNVKFQNMEDCFGVEDQKPHPPAK